MNKGHIGRVPYAKKKLLEREFSREFSRGRQQFAVARGRERGCRSSWEKAVVYMVYMLFI